MTVYIPFFLAANLAYDGPPERQKKFIGTLARVNAVLRIVFAGMLKWIWPKGRRRCKHGLPCLAANDVPRGAAST